MTAVVPDQGIDKASLLGPRLVGGGDRPDAAGQLVRFDFRDHDPTAPHAGCDLAWLGGDGSAEIWELTVPSAFSNTDGRLSMSCGADVALVAMRFRDPGARELAEVTRRAYTAILTKAAQAGYPWMLRTWHFLPAINQGEGDAERYRLFCVGRQQAVSDFAISQLGAATAVGTHGDDVTIHMLVGRRPGEPIENPRQVPAYQYPRAYGPSRPAFARAVAVPQADDCWGLMVSGTASVVGHETQHPGRAMPQLDETIANLSALLGRAAELLGDPSLAEFGAQSCLRVYARCAQDWPAVADRLRAVWPAAGLVGLEADICRSDLAIEIEAYHRGLRPA